MTVSKKPSAKRRKAGRQSTGNSVRRQDIINTAAELFARRGYKATTVREIGEAAGVLSGSLYHHFDSKETILDELISGYLHEIEGRYLEIVEGGHQPEAALRLLVSTAFSSLHTHGAAVTVMQNERAYLDQLPRFSYLGEAERRAHRLWVSVLRSGIDLGVFRKEIDPDTAYRFIRDAVWVSVRWFRRDGSLTEQDLADQYLLILLEGLLAGAAQHRKPLDAAR
ncbi:TetR/AcrR family transcriptional regulator [Streptomyces spiralis]|uniref:TetR/AcrR family transcriptional regulator n=1 Tax=Streptomyces spiralis TaxID=66376 RepID=UPI0033ED30DB